MDRPMTLFVNNVSTINLAKNPILHGRSKHIETWFHFLKDQVNKRKIEVLSLKLKDQVTSILTNPLKVDRFYKIRILLGLTFAISLD